MRALVVYESMFGNTERVAESIAEGLRGFMETDVQDVAGSPSVQAGQYDVIVVGAPTHAFSLSTRRSRRDAWLRGGRAGVMLTGLREWLEELAPPHAAVTAAFDTRTHAVRMLPGSASRTATRILRRKAGASVATRHSFYTAGERGPLCDGELERARSWGEALAVLAGGWPRGETAPEATTVQVPEQQTGEPKREVGSRP